MRTTITFFPSRCSSVSSINRHPRVRRSRLFTFAAIQYRYNSQYPGPNTSYYLTMRRNLSGPFSLNPLNVFTYLRQTNHLTIQRHVASQRPSVLFCSVLFCSHKDTHQVSYTIVATLSRKEWVKMGKKKESKRRGVLALVTSPEMTGRGIRLYMMYKDINLLISWEGGHP